MKKLLLFITFCISLVAYAQTSKWSDLFSYNNVLAIREDGDRMIAATENGVFYYYPGTGEIKKLSKANGLHEVKISAFDYNPVTQTGIVGYQNGSMDVITPNGIFLIVDIPLATGYNGSKRINHISINGDRAVISVGYGVSIFNISRREFGDTAFFATGGVYTIANSAVIKGDIVYAATNSGIKSHPIDSTFPVYTGWTTVLPGIFKKVDAADVAAFATASQVYYGNGTAWTPLPRTFANVQDVKVLNNQIVVSDQTQVYIYSTSGVQQKNFNAGEDINTAFVYNNALFTGTKLSGIYNEQKSSLKPDGPYSNTSYKISLLGNEIWVSTGFRTAFNTPVISNLGYYHFNGNNWVYPDYFKTKSGFNVLDVVPNPTDPSEVFFTNYLQDTQKGIYKMKNDELSKAYTNAVPSYNRPVGCAFDDNSNLFCTVAFMDSTVGTGYYYYDRPNDKFIAKNLNVSNGAQKPITKDGLLYIPVPRVGGLILYNYNNTPLAAADDSYKVLTKNNNLPVPEVISVDIDKNDDLWIGTAEGLRVLSNPKSAILEDSPQTDDIIIEENGLAEELFRDANILQIASDSGNQKWVAVDGGGVFYLSSNGDNTIYHFTKSNSPLPNDTVTDIKIDEKTGKVYFVTLDGIMVYQGDVSEVTSNFGNVLVYPNPVVYAQYKGNVRIRGLAAKTNIRITDAAGNLVHSAVANGGYFEWNLANQRGVRVASGIYYVLMTNEDGTDTATAKIAVVN
ncbi:MAG: hypothetical protein EOO18_02970 [Chryseobacterium sp.]|nr:MAG: hypothetical protein EOO18_02970 [Chryseobacterium sp.]